MATVICLYLVILVDSSNDQMTFYVFKIYLAWKAKCQITEH